MARTDFRPRNFKHCVRRKNSIPLHALSKTSSDYTGSTRISLNSRQQDTKAFRKRSPLSSATYSGRLLQSFISSPQKGGKHATGHRSQCLKSIHRKPPFLNGTSLKHKNSTKTRSFHDQTRSKGCISVSRSSSRLPKVSSLRLEKSGLQFRALPFGLNIAPRVFTRLLKPVAAFLRKRGARIVIYLDDIRRRFTEMAMSLLESLGFIINKEKSILKPTQVLTFLGFTINSVNMTLNLPHDKVTAIQSQCRQLLTLSSVTLRTIAQILGTLEAARPAIWKAPLHYRMLQVQLTQGLQQNQNNYTKVVTLSPQSRQELHWWVLEIESCNGSPVVTPPPDLTIYTDASKRGWGGICLNQQANRKWSASEKLLHMNFLELKSAFLSIQALIRDKRSITVSLNMDNTTVVAYVNHQGGTHSPKLLQLALQLWNWCVKRDIVLVAHHVPGKSNSLAYRESRVFVDNSDWMLDPSLIRPLLSDCKTDLFASRLTHQLPYYVSWRPDSRAFHSDTFSLNWRGLKGYAFPPFNMIPKVLDKIISDQAEVLLVAPVWQAQPWWPLLLHLLIQPPILLPVSPHLLTDPAEPRAIHPMFPRLHLGVFRISYNVTKQRAFQQTLPNYLSQPLDPPHIKPMNPAGNAGAAGVVREKLILFRHL